MLFKEYKANISSGNHSLANMGLADYKGIIGTAASTASFILLLSPSILCLKIWKNKSSKNVPFPPLMEAMARSILMFQQGLVMGVWPIVVTHSIGLLLNLCYLTIYLTFTKDKAEAQKCMLRWSTILVPLTAYTLYEDKSLLEARFATIVTAVTISLMLYHLYAVKYVIASKSTKDLPFPIIVSALCVTFLWTLYGIAINKVALQVQTGFAFCVCAFELSLFAVYPSKPTSGSEQKSGETSDSKKES
ncbi:sugar transporter SWEET1-like isoform X1 [Homalodisca vitripennis]|uniref:sugar transporter SWEET1-like isoform X1 n=2 Tax=Homalodisca vitripennis TaxID=197043 RepID=UPI001EEC1DE8|nr:sugar transporter SWEET1-like isoform X1 [Homalodisca vitripennis]XP_046685769.1 sugar transporter SWEET1-like isoform X1 [Homalodisca vitripennis]